MLVACWLRVAIREAVCFTNAQEMEFEATVVEVVLCPGAKVRLEIAWTLYEGLGIGGRLR